MPTPKPAATKTNKPANKPTSSSENWREETLSRMRALILEADPAIIEERKWVKPTNPLGVPVFSRDGIVCTGETYAKAVKLTFAQGAKLEDPSGLFNASLEANLRRAIDIPEGAHIDANAFKALVRSAVALNLGVSLSKKKPAKKATAEKAPVEKETTKAPAKARAKAPKLLAGGNPQIAKSEGDAPVQAYIAALPGWKREACAWLDALIVRAVPNVKKAVKWNSPFYGVEGQGFFLSVHAFTKYLKIGFFRGTSLKPMPPGESEQGEVRYLNLHEDDVRDEAQMTKWVKQAAKLPGWSK